MFNVAIVGGKETNSYKKFVEKCKNILREKAKEGICIFSTGDEYVDMFATRYRIDVETITADFAKHKKNALKKRNEKLLENCQALIAFRTNLKDIKMIVNFAKDKGIPVREINSI